MPVAFWFRRDLRFDDNTGLQAALQSGEPVVPVFIFDTHILQHLPQKDARVAFLHQTLSDMQAQLRTWGSELKVVYGTPQESWKSLMETHAFSAVYTNRDYEPYARERDPQIIDLLESQGAAFHTYKDHVIFEKEELLTKSGNKPYTVFTPYSKLWKASLTPDHLADRKTEDLVENFWKTNERHEIPSLVSMGFSDTDIPIPPRIPDKAIIETYDETRDYPAQKGTTRVGIHLRFGTMSIRKLARVGKKLNETYLNELIWRDFYSQILWNYPHVAEGPFRPQYAVIPWREDEDQFQAWCAGKTGFPLVDAGMRELNATGHMHNRVRMLVASFLTKHLLINWQRGEDYFAEKLLDFDLASNNGGWQWAAGCGTDAAPYFRIFNPESQLKKFDPQAKYVQKWVPEYGTPAYPRPIVNHKEARERCLAVYKAALDAAKS